MPFAIFSLILRILRTGSLIFISVLRDVLTIDCLALDVILVDCVVTELFFVVVVFLSFFSRDFIWWLAFPPEMIFYK